MKVIINNHAYEMSNKEFNSFIKQIKRMIAKKPTVMSVEKDGTAMMQNTVFKTQKELTAVIKEFNKKGYKVNYIRGI